MPLNTVHIEEVFSSKEGEIRKLLSSILNLNIQHESSEKCIVAIINRLLSTAKGRKEGLEYLNLVIHNCSASIITENALSWVNHCIIKFPDDILRELKLRILGEIIEVAHLESDFNKKFVSDYISKVLDNCITSTHINPYECKTALRTLTTCMKYYSNWFGSHREKIEKFILIFLDSPNGELVQAAAVAFLYLQQVGSGGSQGVNHKLNFTQNFDKLCNTIQKLCDQFFENEKELFYNESSENEVFEFPDDPAHDSQTVMHNNARRISNVFKFIEAMIKNSYPVAKDTKPKILLQSITRCLSIHKCITGDSTESLETFQFSLLLSDIQCAALKLLRLFIIWYKGNCLPFSYSISKLIVDSIGKTHNCDCYNFNSLYQEFAYRALIEWIAIARSSLHQQFQSQLLENILRDITTIKTQVTLTISEAVSAKKSQKAKRRAMVNRIISSGNQSLTKESTTSHGKCQQEVACQFALIALKHLLEYTALNVKSSLLKDLYKSIFDSLINIQAGNIVPPYADSKCQVLLYEVLVAIYHQNALLILPPLQTTLAVLNGGANSNNRFVASRCHEGLKMLESFCQPICPSLYVGLEKNEFEVEEPKLMSGANEREEVENNGSEKDSVDFDAATDELFDRNNSGLRDSSSETIGYHVRYTDTDRSSVDDIFSEKGTNNEEVEVQELDPDVPHITQDREHEMKISEYPVVRAPSEDGNEILEGHDEAQTLETIIEDLEEALNDNVQDNPESSADPASTQKPKQDHTNSNESSQPSEVDVLNRSSIHQAKEGEINENEDIPGSSTDPAATQEPKQNHANSNESSQPSEADVLKRSLMRQAKEGEINENEVSSAVEATSILHEVQNGKQKAASNSEIDTHEPPTKKAKIMLEEDAEEKLQLLIDTDNVSNSSQINVEELATKKSKITPDIDSTSQKGDDDPDATYLKDDSFVDEVKDYY